MTSDEFDLYWLARLEFENRPNVRLSMREANKYGEVPMVALFADDGGEHVAYVLMNVNFIDDPVARRKLARRLRLDYQRIKSPINVGAGNRRRSI